MRTRPGSDRAASASAGSWAIARVMQLFCRPPGFVAPDAGAFVHDGADEGLSGLAGCLGRRPADERRRTLLGLLGEPGVTVMPTVNQRTRRRRGSGGRPLAALAVGQEVAGEGRCLPVVARVADGLPVGADAGLTGRAALGGLAIVTMIVAVSGMHVLSVRTWDCRLTGHGVVVEAGRRVEEPGIVGRVQAARASATCRRPCSGTSAGGGYRQGDRRPRPECRRSCDRIGNIAQPPRSSGLPTMLGPRGVMRSKSHRDLDRSPVSYDRSPLRS